MTNLEKWRFYLKDFTSPESYIDWGWYFTVGAALQRRVWIGTMEMPIFPNLYIVYVCRPGIGKSLVINTVADFLKFHPLNTKAPKHNGEILDKRYLDGNDMLDAAGASLKDKALLLPIAANATTYEALVRAIATNTRFVEYPEFDPEAGRIVNKVYGHCSTSFILSEFGSLLRKNTEDVVSLIQETYDCKDYTYDTKTQGKDQIRRCCVSIIAGATPDFLQRVFTDELLSEGISSRTIFIYELKNRFNKAFIADFTKEQLAAKRDLLEHIKKLAFLYGKIELEPGLMEYVEEWWDSEASGKTRINKSMCLDHYYARKNLHALKTAMALHFSESTELKLSKKEVDRAIELLRKTELNMHFAVALDNKNPLVPVMKRITQYVARYGPQTQSDLVIEFIGSVENGPTGIKEGLELLCTMGRLELKKGEDGKFRYYTTEQDNPKGSNNKEEKL